MQSDPAQQQPEPIHSIKVCNLKSHRGDLLNYFIQLKFVQIQVKTPAEFLDRIRRVITDAFADDNVMLTKALEKFLVFSSFLKEDSVIESISDLIELNEFNQFWFQKFN